MNDSKTIKFAAQIEIIGINPFVLLPDNVLQFVFKQANKSKGKIPIKMRIDGHLFIQTLIRYSGDWRLYLNTAMRKAAKKDVGDKANFEVCYDPVKRNFQIHPEFLKALDKNKKARQVFDNLRPSLQVEINKYFSFLKTEESVDKNIIKAINFLLGKGRFIARDNP